MATRKVRTNLVSYMENVLERNGVAYILEKNRDKEYSFITSNLSSNAYNKHLERAMCEQESRELHNGRTVISYREYLHHTIIPQRGGCYHILSKDLPLYNKALGIA